jgi:modulator of FtsH protease HflC
MKKVVVAVVVVLVVLIVVVLLGPFYTITEGEQAVVTRFGKIVSSATTAGLKMKAPFVDTVIKYPRKIMAWDGAPQIIPTAEKKFVYVDTTARWRIVDPQKFYESLGTITQAHSRLDDLIDGEVRTVISSNSFAEAVRNSNDILSYVKLPAAGQSESASVSPQSDALALDKISKGRKALSQVVVGVVAKIVPQFGMELDDVVIRQIKYSDELTKSVYDRMIKERNKEAERYRSEGLGEKDYWLGRMQNELDSIQSGAYKESETIKGDADAKAARIYALAYNQDPEFYSYWKALDSYRKLLPKFKKTLTTDPEYFKYLYRANAR